MVQTNPRWELEKRWLTYRNQNFIKKKDEHDQGGNINVPSHNQRKEEKPAKTLKMPRNKPQDALGEGEKKKIRKTREMKRTQ